jgi:hypothetical protein
MNNLSKICLYAIVIFTICIVAASAQISDFDILQDKRQIGAILDCHSEFIGTGCFYPAPEPVPFWLRVPNIKTAGDYYRHPAGADEVALTEYDIEEASTALNTLIREQFFNAYVLRNLKGYKYELLGGEVKRREYYVKYSCEDTIYVISGLLGKFLSFYRVVPGQFSFSVDQLKKEVAQLSHAVEFKNDDSFIEKKNQYIYFVEYIDRDKMLRVRNYQIVEPWQETDKDRNDSLGKYFNLIEITKFLDEEAMP